MSNIWMVLLTPIGIKPPMLTTLFTVNTTPIIAVIMIMWAILIARFTLDGTMNIYDNVHH
jgi:hypothetical protein